MQYFGIHRHAQLMIEYEILTEFLGKIHNRILL